MYVKVIDPGPMAIWFSGNGTRQQKADSEIVTVDGRFWDDSFEQDQSHEDSATTISRI